MEDKRFGLTTFQLKIIAIVTMLIDHVGYVFYIQLGAAYTYFRIIGRIAFPIFCFLLVQGFTHTHSKKAYAARLALFCLISEPFFDRAFHYTWYYPDNQNVFFTLLIGFCTIWLIDTVWKWEPEKKALGWLKDLLPLVIAVGACALACVLQTDYSYKGVLFILGFYCFRKNPLAAAIYFVIVNYITGNNRPEYLISYLQVSGGLKGIGSSYLGEYMKFAVQDAAVLAIFPILLYNGKKGRSMKWFFYGFYPAHLLLLYLIYGVCFG